MAGSSRVVETPATAMVFWARNSRALSAIVGMLYLGVQYEYGECTGALQALAAGPQDNSSAISGRRPFLPTRGDPGVTGSDPPLRTLARGEIHDERRPVQRPQDQRRDDPRVLVGLGTGILTARVAPLTGLYEFRSFDMAYRVEADSLAAFVDATPAGHYLVFAVIIDGASRATERFYVALESLGSTRIRQVKSGDSWTFIARKGGGQLPGLPAEHLSTTGLALDSVEVPARFGNGTMEALPLPRAAHWGVFGWEFSGAGLESPSPGFGRPGSSIRSSSPPHLPVSTPSDR